jgi:hypothetical protein
VESETVVASHKAALHRLMEHETMAAEGPYATVKNRAHFRRMPSGRYLPTPARRRIHEQLLAQIEDLEGQCLQEKHAIIMAGPPGAGKGRVQAERLGDLRGYVRSDPDQFKEALLKHMLSTGEFNQLRFPELLELEAEGHRFAPLEMASLVHEESSILAATLQQRALSSGTNLVIDTVLKSNEKADRLIADLEQAGYSYEVVDVEVPREITEAQIDRRWREPYKKFLQGRHVLGGRAVPPDFVASMFDREDGRSWPEVSARHLADTGPHCIRYRLFIGDGTGPHQLSIDKHRNR